jgi:proline racemase
MEKEKVSYSVIDYHTAGEVARMLVSGCPPIKGKTMEDKGRFFASNLDYIRTMLMQEPRGHVGIMGAVLTAPCRREAQLGAIFMDGRGYHNMCGHVSIAIGKMVLERGIFSVQGEKPILLDTPAGLITLTPKMTGKSIDRVAFKNVPSFLYREKKMDIPGLGPIHISIVFGGNFFALVDASQLGLKLEGTSKEELIDIGMSVYKTVNKKEKIQHPLQPEIAKLDVAMIYQYIHPEEPFYKSIVVFGERQFDRSPCGTGTSSLIALLHAKGKLTLGQRFTNESIIGTTFSGIILEEIKVGPFSGVVPEIAGSSHIIGINQFLVDDCDPLKYGFNIYNNST